VGKSICCCKKRAIVNAAGNEGIDLDETKSIHTPLERSPISFRQLFNREHLTMNMVLNPVADFIMERKR
jgi:hypothetical protein